MYKKDRVYRLGFKERHTVYELEDIANSEKVDLFNKNPEWEGDAKTYAYYLHTGENRKLSSDYRVLKKKALVMKVVKLFFKMVVSDILNGEKVRIGTRAFYLFIGHRDVDSPKYVFNLKQHGIDYIPYVKLSKRLTNGYAYNLMFLTLVGVYQRAFRSKLRSGIKYR
jgi:hypothetical protein